MPNALTGSSPPPQGGDHQAPLVLIGFAEALSAPEVAWNLLDNGFQVAAFQRRGGNPAIRRIKKLRLIEVTAPEDDARETVSQLQRAAEHLQAALLLPLDDFAIWLGDAVSSESTIPLAVPSGSQARLALDKRLQLQAAADAGFTIPPTRYISAAQQLSAIDCFPVVLKPALAVAAIGGRLQQGRMHFCANRQELDVVARNWKRHLPMLAQPLLSGTGEGLFGLATPNAVQRWSAHRRVRMMNPAGSGSSACRSLALSDQPLACAESMIRQIKWQGQFMIELLRDHTDRVWFMELNGRSWGSMALALRRGFEYPAWTVMQAMDPSFTPPPVPSGEPLLCRHLGREIVHVLMVLRGRRSNPLLQFPSRWKTIPEVCRLTHRDCWYNWRPGNRRLFLEDAARTVWDNTLRKWLAA